MDPIPGPEPHLTLPDDDGTVRVAVRCPVSRERAWRALTDGADLEQWFGVVSQEPLPGADLRLDFEDGDFFALHIDEVNAPVLRWTWRFMGIGPVDRLEARVNEGDDGNSSLVTVTDRRPGRGADDARALGEGWRDFLFRLQRFLATGERTRYDWRSDVEVWVELPVPQHIARRELILSAAKWLPLAPGAENLLTAQALVLSDGEEPAWLPLDEVRGDGPGSVTFAVSLPGVAGQLRTRIEIGSSGDGATLALTQTGFRDLDTDDRARQRIRRRLADAWVRAARRAEALLTRSAPADAKFASHAT